MNEIPSQLGCFTSLVRDEAGTRVEVARAEEVPNWFRSGLGRTMALKCC